MSKFLSLCVSILLLQGCAGGMFHSDHYPSRFSQYGYGYKPKINPLDQELVSDKTYKILKKYADRIATELSTQVLPSEITQLSVASFVDFDDNLQSSNALGNKLAETLTISLSEKGYNLQELNLAKNITSNERGNFVFERSHQNQDPTPYIVSGVISYTDSGAIVNSRLIETTSAKILAVNSLFLPNFVLAKEFPMVEGSDLIIKNN